VYFRTTYYLAPHDEAAAKPYALLQRAMQKAGRVAIATLVMRNKEYLVAIRPQGAALTLETMFFADEVRSAERELPYLSGVAEPSEREVELASVLVDAMKGEWEPERYHDTHRERVDELVEEKRQGREIVHEPAPAAAGRVVDLMEALQASVAAAAGRSSAPEAEPAPARRPVKAASAGTARRAQAPAPVRRGGGATRGQPAEASQGDGADGADEAKGRSSARRTRQAAKAAPAAGSRDAPKAKKAAKRPAAARLREVS
jgi:DNA end-binding protein Ku